MKKMLWLSMIVLALGLPFVACNQTKQADVTRTETKAKITDSDLENKIKSRFDADPQLKAANLDVDANVDRNEITIAGTVESQSMRMQAVEMAKNAHPGVIVNDKIDVKPRELARTDYTREHATEQRAKAKERGEKIGDTLDDAWIHMKIVSKLIGSPSTPERKINVDVLKNVVTLRGTVDSADQKAEAERIAKETEGVKSVRNLLKVAGSKTAAR